MCEEIKKKDETGYLSKEREISNDSINSIGVDHRYIYVEFECVISKFLENLLLLWGLHFSPLLVVFKTCHLHSFSWRNRPRSTTVEGFAREIYVGVICAKVESYVRIGNLFWFQIPCNQWILFKRGISNWHIQTQL